MNGEGKLPENAMQSAPQTANITGDKGAQLLIQPQQIKTEETINQTLQEPNNLIFQSGATGQSTEVPNTLLQAGMYYLFKILCSLGYSVCIIIWYMCMCTDFQRTKPA